ncbi:MAG: helix-turn-helix transcriptional regulator [Clostridia bacterium]|nr:helix-turn-helix transcriptional regulator [Clostridia bacterium]MBQ5798506.1 helix-turn-helix transcriptional regulator [Clostridia bacterium]
MAEKPYFVFSSAIDGEYKKSGAHYHDTVEIYFLLDGRCWYFIDNKSYLLDSGDIAIIPSGVIHKTNYETPRHSRLLINCDEWFISKTIKNTLRNMPCFPKSDASFQKCQKLFAEIEKESKTNDEFSYDVIRAKISELLILIARENKEKVPDVVQSAIIEKAVRYIQKNHQGSVTLEDTAKHCFVSAAHLSRTFKKETGFGFCEYLNIYRLKKADALLSDGEKYKISEIAEMCGFEDSNYFSKMYKRMYGIPPRERKKS